MSFQNFHILPREQLNGQIVKNLFKSFQTRKNQINNFFQEKGFKNSNSNCLKKLSQTHVKKNCYLDKVKPFKSMFLSLKKAEDMKTVQKQKQTYQQNCIYDNEDCLVYQQLKQKVKIIEMGEIECFLGELSQSIQTDYKNKAKKTQKIQSKTVSQRFDTKTENINIQKYYVLSFIQFMVRQIKTKISSSKSYFQPKDIDTKFYVQLKYITQNKNYLNDQKHSQLNIITAQSFLELIIGKIQNYLFFFIEKNHQDCTNNIQDKKQKIPTCQKNINQEKLIAFLLQIILLLVRNNMLRRLIVAQQSLIQLNQQGQSFYQKIRQNSDNFQTIIEKSFIEFLNKQQMYDPNFNTYYPENNNFQNNKTLNNKLYRKNYQFHNTPVNLKQFLPAFPRLQEKETYLLDSFCFQSENQNVFSSQSESKLKLLLKISQNPSNSYNSQKQTFQNAKKMKNLLVQKIINPNDSLQKNKKDQHYRQSHEEKEELEQWNNTFGHLLLQI